VFDKSTHINPGDTPYNGLYGDSPPERDTFLGCRYGKWVPFSVWRYVKGVPFQANFRNLVCKSVPILQNLVFERVRGPGAVHPRIKSIVTILGHQQGATHSKFFEIKTVRLSMSVSIYGN